MIVIEKHALTHLLRRKERIENVMELIKMYQVKSLEELSGAFKRDLEEVNQVIKELTR
ncbi:MAG: hypothetical protein ABFC84_16845 [Veillonellales bacterium]